MRASRSGFTLMELAIVLAIIGLMIGGIMGGQAMLKASRLRGVMSEAAAHANAIAAFRTQYEELPGDYSMATRVWSTAAANGNGNGILEGASVASGAGENFQVWKHLQLGGFTTGSFTGTAGGAAPTHAVPGTNVPRGPLTKSGFWHYSWGQQAAGTTYFPGNYDNAMVFGGERTNDWLSQAVLTGSEAYQIDLKVDDQMPGYGEVRTFAGTWMASANTPACISAAPNGDSAATAAYIRTSDAPGCILLFLSGFGALTQR